MKNRIIAIVLFILVIALGITYIYIGPPQSVRVIVPPSLIASLPMWVAEHENIFSKKNIQVEFIQLTSSSNMVDAMISGNADVLPAVSLHNLVTGGTRDNQALMQVIIYSHSRMRKSPPFDSLLTNTSTSISTLRDLVGKKIAVYPGTTAEMTLRHFLSINNINSDEVTYVKLPPPEHEPALLRADVAASFSYEPYRSVSLENGKTRELYGSIYASLSEPSAIGVSAVSRSFYRNKTESAKKFLDAWDEALMYIRSNPKSARKILADKLGLSDSIAANATWVDATTTNETDFHIVDNTISAMKNAKMIPLDFILERDMVIRK
ncbi:MAG: ABC transporter substrate-binding protein [Magnetococcales bacterium]|nr:ABC transporter substrate-binding protein [Magnetococcales bacterium]